ncbi:TonB-dependent receptor plug domain-containing protein [Winogradskyella haliclonae]|uniref:TonB-dependent receptor n=1 Tax=Winogradskyella haliclonae TaxID=2048558 RepID=A0ABQ2BXN2_9FLAO|nr:TonB-dependent receptor [Winogradskyella haliclonae]GGI57235.1 TonB-dependent receptor [Winogradskyella haliclonae]
MSLNKNYFCIYFLLFFLSYSQAQETKPVKKDSTDTEKLDEVLITATRTIRQLSTVPLPVQIITRKQIQAINSVRLTDLLNEYTGLITVPDFGGGEGIQLQGLDSQYVLILLDGVPLVGRSAGTLDLNRVTVGNIKQLEIVKGPSSALYGNEALGGVVNIITADPIEGFSGDISHRLSTFNNNDTNLNLSFKEENFGITAFVNRFSSDGYDLNPFNQTQTVEPFKTFTIFSKLTYDFNDDTRLTFSGRYFQNDQDNVGENVSTGEVFRGESKEEDLNGTLLLNHTFNEKWKGQLEFYISNYNTIEFLNDDVGDNFTQSEFDQYFIRPEVRAVYTINKNNEFVLGAGYTKETLDRTNFSISPEFNSPYLYGQYDFNPIKKVNIIAGFRYDSHNVYTDQLSPKLAIQYDITKKLSLKGSLGYGYKAPDFRQLFLDFTNSLVGYTVLGYNVAPQRLQDLADNGFLTAGSIANLPNILSMFNEDLQAESSVGINIGAEFKPTNSIKASINFFRNDVSNLIDVIPVAQRSNGQNVFSYFNRNEVYFQGLELNSSWAVNKNFTISGGYQYLIAKDKEEKQDFEDGRVFGRDQSTGLDFQLDKNDYFGLPGRARHLGNSKLFYKNIKGNFDANLRVQVSGKQGFMDTNGNGYVDNFDDFLPSYAIWDIALNKTFFENYRMSLGVDNLFDFTDPISNPNDNNSITQIPGRMYYARIKVNF